LKRLRALVATAVALTGSSVVMAVAPAAVAHAVDNPTSTVFINEIHYDNAGTDVGEFVEVAGPAGTDLTGWTLVLYNGSGGAVYDTDPLPSPIPDEGGGYGTVALTYPANGIQNGNPDGIALVNNDVVVQFLSYGGSFVGVGGPADGLTSTDIGVVEPTTSPIGESLQLVGAGFTYGDFTWQAPTAESPGVINVGQTFGAAPLTAVDPGDKAFVIDVEIDPIVLTATGGAGSYEFAVSALPAGLEFDDVDTISGTPTELGDTLVTITVTDADEDSDTEQFTITVAEPLTVTPISQVQGTTDTSPLVGQEVAIEGIVVGDYEGPSGTLRGFYVQSRDQDVDDDPRTSEGIFVFNFDNDGVNVGDEVYVEGVVAEQQGQTQLGSPSVLTVLSTDNTVTPTIVSLPKATADAFEAYEGMLVTVPQTLYVTEYFQTARSGEVVTSTIDHLPQPTAVVDPGQDAIALQAANNLTKLILDDADNLSNADPLQALVNGAPITAANPLRGGDTIAGATGVMTYTWGGYSASPNNWRLRPASPTADQFDFTTANPRPTAPPQVGGTLKIVGFNVLNYFRTLDIGTQQNCGVIGERQECRGAETAEELTRQHDKLIAALLDIDADVYGFAELENTETTPGVSVDVLGPIVESLNDELGDEVWAAVDTGLIGTDTIRVGVIYRTDTVEVIDWDVMDADSFPGFDDDNNRPALAVALREVATDGVLTVAVNHWKSKGSCPASGPDADLGDGAACWNAARVNAAESLLAWLDTDPLDVDDEDVLIFGDLNSYAQEAPIDVLIDAGYVDVVQYFAPGAHSYVFDGQWGTLDYAIASASLAGQVTGAGDYHINADEMPLLDYNTNFKSPAQIAAWYAPDQFRTSDHDPALVGIALAELAAPVPSVTPSLPLTNDTEVTFTVQFSEPVIGFDDAATDIVVGGTAGATTGLISGADDTYTVTVTAPADGTVTLSIPAGAALDANDLITPSVASGTATTLVDTVAPTVTVAYVGPSPTNAASLSFNVSLSESATLTEADIELASDVVVEIESVVGAGTSWTVTVSVPEDADGQVSLGVATGVTDAAGNASIASNVVSVAVDRVAPTVTVAYSGSAPTNAATLSFDVTLSEDGTLTAGDVDLDSDVGSTVESVTGAGSSWTVTVSVPVGADGDVSVGVVAGGVTDDAGNASAASNVVSVAVDRVAPTVTAAYSGTSPTNSALVPFDVTSSDPASLATGDFVVGGVAGASVASVDGSGDPIIVRVNVPVGATGNLTLGVVAGAVTDGVGNVSAASNVVSVAVDRAAPSVAVSAVDPGIEFGEDAVFSVVFSEAVTGAFDASDLTIGGTSATPTITGTGPTYTVTFAAVAEAGTITLAVKTGAVTDLAGNPNTASAAPAAQVIVVAPLEPPVEVDVIIPVEPARYWDSREGEPTFDDEFDGTGFLGADQIFKILIADRGDVPDDAIGVVANLTVIEPDGPGFATLYPCTATVPKASHVNYLPGDIVANNVVVPLQGGEICVYTKAGADFALDVNGYVPADSPLVGITPTRYLDTRTDGSAVTFDHASEGEGIVAAEGIARVQIADRGDIPPEATAVFVNVTAVGPEGPGYLRLFPCGDLPATSTLNYMPGQIVPNGALASLSDDGELCIMSKAASHVIVDVAGYVTEGVEGLSAIAPERFLDTRPGQPPLIDGSATGTPGRLAAEQQIEVQVTGRGSVPDTATAVLFNLTVVDPDGPGYLTLFPCTDTVPKASNVNHATAGLVRANNAFTQLSAEGTVCIFAKAGGDVIVDVTGWVE